MIQRSVVLITSKIANLDLIEILAHRLITGETLTCNSERPIVELVLSPLEELIAAKTQLSRIMVVGEKAGAWAYYTSDGRLHAVFDTTLAVPTMLTSMIRELVEDPLFRDVLEIESGKRTMIRVIRRQDLPLDLFHQIQATFVPLAQHGLDVLGLSADWKIDLVSDQVEIKHRCAGKGKGAQRIMRWLYAHGMSPDHIVATNDRPSRGAMGDTLDQLRVPVIFVFTGATHRRETVFPVVCTMKRDVQGTLHCITMLDLSPRRLLAKGEVSWK